MRLPDFGVARMSTQGIADWVKAIIRAVMQSFHVEHDTNGLHRTTWITPVKNTARFTGLSPLVWSVDTADILAERYMVLGNTMWWLLQVASTSTSGSAAGRLHVTLPDGYRMKSGCVFPTAYLADAGTAVAGYVGRVNDDQVGIFRLDSGTFSAAASSNTAVYFTIVLEVQR